MRQIASNSSLTIERHVVPHNLHENKRFSMDLGQDLPSTSYLRINATGGGFVVFP
jgi:hypothetical protein